MRIFETLFAEERRNCVVILHAALRERYTAHAGRCIWGFYEVATLGRAPAPQVDRSLAFSRTRRVVKSVGRQPFHAP